MIAFAASASALVASRALFQAPWAIATAAAAFCGLRSKHHRQRILFTLTAPAAFALALTLKNGLMFDVWSNSSWYGMNLAKLVREAVEDELPSLVQTGVVSPTFAVGPFQPIDEYPVALTSAAQSLMQARHGARRVLSTERAQSGLANYNHAGYLAVSRQFAAESVAVMRARPESVKQAVIDSMVMFLEPASDFQMVERNRAALEHLERLYRACLYPDGTRALVGLNLLFAVLTATYLWVVGFEEEQWMAPAAGYVLVTVVWTTIVCNLVEHGENNRFRFTLDPMVFTWNAVVLARLWHRLRTLRSARMADVTP